MIISFSFNAPFVAHFNERNGNSKCTFCLQNYYAETTTALLSKHSNLSP